MAVFVAPLLLLPHGLNLLGFAPIGRLNDNNEARARDVDMRKVFCFTGVIGVVLMMATGCALKEIRTKTKLGVEYRHTNIDKTDLKRYLVQKAIQFKWDNGVDTSVIYRRRDLSNSDSNDSDDGVWFEIGFPIWKAPSKKDALAARVAHLEKLVSKLQQSSAQSPAAIAELSSPQEN